MPPVKKLLNVEPPSVYKNTIIRGLESEDCKLVWENVEMHGVSAMLHWLAGWVLPVPQLCLMMEKICNQSVPH